MSYTTGKDIGDTLHCMNCNLGRVEEVNHIYDIRILLFNERTEFLNV